MKKTAKGTYGYIDSQKKIELIKSLVLFGLALAIFLVGYYTTGTKKNYFTIIAVLSVLPAAKVLATTIVFLKNRTMKKEFYDLITPYEGTLSVVYDLVVTAYEKTFSIDAAAVAGKTVIVFSDSAKTDIPYAEKYLKDMMLNNGIKGSSVKIFKEIKPYVERMKTMNENLSQDRNEAKEETIIRTLMALSI